MARELLAVVQLRDRRAAVLAGLGVGPVGGGGRVTAAADDLFGADTEPVTDPAEMDDHEQPRKSQASRLVEMALERCAILACATEGVQGVQGVEGAFEASGHPRGRGQLPGGYSGQHAAQQLCGIAGIDAVRVVWADRADPCRGRGDRPSRGQDGQALRSDSDRHGLVG